MTNSLYWYNKANQLYLDNRDSFEVDLTLTIKKINLAFKIEDWFNKVNIKDLDNKQAFTFRLRRANICSLLVIAHYSEKLYLGKVDYNEAIKFSRIAIQLLQEIDLNDEYFLILNQEQKDAVLKTKTQYLRNTFYNTGNVYFLIGDTAKSIEFYTKGSDLKHIPSIFNLAAIYSEENSIFFDKSLGGDMYIEAANTEFDGNGNDNNALTIKSISYAKAGSVYLERRQYDNALSMYENALREEFSPYVPNDAFQYIQSRIRLIESIKLKESKYSPKHDYVLKLLSEKAQRHLNEQHYIYIETSLLVFDFLNENKYEYLDYSSAIMPILKCLENLFYPIIGVEYLNYLKTLNNIDFERIPNNFVTKNYKTKEKCLVNKIDGLELGNCLYAIAYRPFSDQMILNKYFLNFMVSRGVKQKDSIYIQFVKELGEIKDRYRNVAAHKDMVDHLLAKDCFDYLLETIKFINRFLENFYPD